MIGIKAGSTLRLKRQSKRLDIRMLQKYSIERTGSILHTLQMEIVGVEPSDLILTVIDGDSLLMVRLSLVKC